MKILVLDIETGPATVLTFGIHKQHIGAHQIIEDGKILCFAAKWYGEKRMHFGSSESGDSETMLLKLYDLLDEADAVVHYNGKSFDIPHIQGQMYLHSILPPSPFFQIDLWKTVRSQFRFLSNKLDEVAKRRGLGEKHETSFDLWKRCHFGERAAWKQMGDYNKQDVLLTEALYVDLLPWIKGHPSKNLIDGEGDVCPTCGAGALQKRGFAHTKVSSFQRYQCLACGSYSRSNKRVAGVGVQGL